MPAPYPLAVGLIAHDPLPTPDRRLALAVRIGAFATTEGFALAQTYELMGIPIRDASVIAAIEDSVTRFDVSAVLVSGETTRALAALAARSQLSIVNVTE